MDIGFIGYMRQGTGRTFPISLYNDATGNVVDPDSPTGTWRIYGQSFVQNGTLGYLENGVITAASNTAPIVITSNNHNLTSGQFVNTAGVTGNTAANVTTTQITRVDANTFQLNGTTGNGAYISGGTWNTSGLYGITLSDADSLNYDPGMVYTCVVSYKVAGVPKTISFTFGVN
jgi:hypothetical protein